MSIRHGATVVPAKATKAVIPAKATKAVIPAKATKAVIPAKAGIQVFVETNQNLGSRLRGNDGALLP